MLFSGKLIRDFPTDASVLEHCMPEEFVEMNGWSEDITHIRNYEELPLNAKKYLERYTVPPFALTQRAKFSWGKEQP